MNEDGDQDLAERGIVIVYEDDGSRARPQLLTSKRPQSIGNVNKLESNQEYHVETESNCAQLLVDDDKSETRGNIQPENASNKHGQLSGKSYEGRTRKKPKKFSDYETDDIAKISKTNESKTKKIDLRSREALTEQSELTERNLIIQAVDHILERQNEPDARVHVETVNSLTLEDGNGTQQEYTVIPSENQDNVAILVSEKDNSEYENLLLQVENATKEQEAADDSEILQGNEISVAKENMECVATDSGVIELASEVQPDPEVGSLVETAQPVGNVEIAGGADLVTAADNADRIACEALSELAAGPNNKKLKEMEAAAESVRQCLTGFLTDPENQKRKGNPLPQQLNMVCDNDEYTVQVYDPSFKDQRVREKKQGLKQTREEHVVSTNCLADLIKNLKEKETIFDHMRRITLDGGSKKGFECLHCKAKVRDRHEVRKHLRNHDDVEFKPFWCPLCPYKADVKAGIARHINIHGPVTPYVCSECGKGFNFKQKLVVHMKYHLDIRDYQCPECPKTFHEFKTMKIHAKTVHKLTLKGQRGRQKESHAMDRELEASVQKAIDKKLSRSQEDEAEANDQSTNQKSDGESNLSGNQCDLVYIIRNPSEDSANPIQSPVEATVSHIDSDAGNTNQNITKADPSDLQEIDIAYPLSEASVKNAPPNPKIVDEEFGESSKETYNKIKIVDQNDPEPSQSGDKSMHIEIYNDIIDMDESDIDLDNLVDQGDIRKYDVIDSNRTNKTTRATQQFKSGQLSARSVNSTINSYKVRTSTNKLGMENSTKRMSFINKNEMPEKKRHDLKNLTSEQTKDVISTHGQLLKREMNGSTVIICRLCAEPSQAFLYRTNFLAHLENVHKDISPWKCDKCDYACRQRTTLILHLKAHMGDRPYKCNYCDKCFQNKTKLQDHILVHLNTRDHRCDQCNSNFNTKADLARHISRVHIGERPYKCEKCGKAYKNSYQLEQHMDCHLPDKKFECHVCHKKYQSRASLRQHVKCHSCMFHCEICNRSFGSYSGFMAHKVMHDESFEGYRCDQCNKVLHTKGSLMRHKNVVHTVLRPHTCHICSKAFKTTKDLKCHLVVHENYKKHICHICHFRCKRPESLRIHMLRHAEGKPFKCEECGKEYTQRNGLLVHMKQHLPATSFYCQTCATEFPTKYQLWLHMKRHHAEQPPEGDDGSAEVAPSGDIAEESVTMFMCEECNAVFNTQDNLAVHILAEHMKQVVLKKTKNQTDLTEQNEVEITATEEVIMNSPAGDELQTFIAVTDPNTSRKHYVSVMQPKDCKRDENELCLADGSHPSLQIVEEEVTEELPSIINAEGKIDETLVSVTNPETKEEVLVSMPRGNFESLLLQAEPTGDQEYITMVTDQHDVLPDDVMQTDEAVLRDGEVTVLYQDTGFEKDGLVQYESSKMETDDDENNMDLELNAANQPLNE